MRWLLPLCLLSACGVQGPVTVGGGAGGGIVSSGGGAATGGGDGSLGGGSALGGGDGALGGGDGALGGGLGVTGGGSAVTGGGTPDAGLPPLTWALMSINGTTSDSFIVGLSGSKGDLWAVQDTGWLFHSTGGAFNAVSKAFNSAMGLYASDGGVLVITRRGVHRCPGECEDAGSFSSLDLLDTPINWDYYAEGAICGEGMDHLVVVVSDTSNAAHLLEWNGSTWTMGANSLGIAQPRRCWFDEHGGLYVSGLGGLVYLDEGASTPVTLGQVSAQFYGGVTLDGTTWVSGSAQVSGDSVLMKGTGTTFSQLSTPGADSLLWAVGGLRSDEVFVVGSYTTSNAIGSGFVWNGAQLKKLGDTLPNMRSQSSVRVVHPAAPNELFVAGTDGNGPVILRGRR